MTTEDSNVVERTITLTTQELFARVADYMVRVYWENKIGGTSSSFFTSRFDYIRKEIENDIKSQVFGHIAFKELFPDFDATKFSYVKIRLVKIDGTVFILTQDEIKMK